MLSRDQILSTSDMVSHAVEVPEWGGTIYVRTLTGFERDQFEEAAYRTSEQGHLIRGMRVLLLCLTLCDESGERLFEDTDLVALGKKSGSVIDRLFDFSRQVNGLLDTSLDEAKKNSESVPHNGSGTA